MTVPVLALMSDYKSGTKTMILSLPGTSVFVKTKNCKLMPHDVSFESNFMNEETNWVSAGSGVAVMCSEELENDPEWCCLGLKLYWSDQKYKTIITF